MTYTRPPAYRPVTRYPHRRPVGQRILRAFAWAGLAWITATGALALWLIQSPVIADPYLTRITVALIAESVASALVILVVTR